MEPNQENKEENEEDNKNAEITLKKPHFVKKKENNVRSSSAPIEQTSEEENSSDFLSSYNYFLYYNSLKPVDPRIPKPTYRPKPDLEYIKENHKEEEESNENLNENVVNLTEDMDNLNIQEKEEGNQNIGVTSNLLNDSQNKTTKDKWGSNEINQQFSNFDTSIPLNNQDEQNYIEQEDAQQEQNLMGQFKNFNGKGMFNPGQIISPFAGVPMGGQIPQNITGGKKGNKKGQFNNRMYYNNRQQQIQPNFEQMMIQPSPIINMNYYSGMPFNPNMMGNGPNMMGGFGNFAGFADGGNGFNMIPLNVGMNFQGMGFPLGMGQNMDMNNYYFNQQINNQRPNPNNMNSHLKKQNKKMNDNNKRDTQDSLNPEDIIEKAVEYAKDHSGSRLVQKKYQEGNKEFNDKIFEKLKPEIYNLSKDVFGNYAIQIVLQSKDEKKNSIIMNALTGNIYELSTHMYGCRVIQELITVIDQKYIPTITSELKDHYSKCIEDQNGNHVIQKLIERLPKGVNNGIYDVVLNNILNFAKHQYGCRVIQTLFKQCNEEQICAMLDGIYKNLRDLIEDQYGNYVIQYILENRNGNRVEPIYEGLKGHVKDFSLHKYASNVVERALTYGNRTQRQEIIKEIILEDDQKQECLLSMVKDKFGNYVVQKIIEFSDDEKQRENIIQRIITSQSLKKKDGFSKHVINFIDKINMNKSNSLIDNSGNYQNNH